MIHSQVVRCKIPYFLIEEVIASYIHKPVDEFHQTDKLKEKKR